jgi:RNA polymerase sigma-70 factor (ECF subfamily)
MGEESAVVQRALAGDAHAQEQLFARYTGKLYRIALGLLKNKEDAEDAVQDGLSRAYINLRNFQGRSSFATWLTRIVINSSLMTLRRRRGHPETSLDEILETQSEPLPRGVVKERPDSEKIAAANEIHALVEQHVLQLPAALRAAFHLAVIEGLSAAESGEVLGISVSAFKSRIFWARRKVICGLQQSLKMTTSARALAFRRRGHRTVR